MHPFCRVMFNSISSEPPCLTTALVVHGHVTGAGRIGTVIGFDGSMRLILGFSFALGSLLNG